MPELPEVETVRNSLKLKINGRRIEEAIVRYDGIIGEPSVDEFCKKIKNQRINDIDRYGKWLIFILDDYCLLSHLRMEGKFFIRDNDKGYNSHDHVIFKLDDGNYLIYNDVRKFGKMHLINRDEYMKSSILSKLGLEPWNKRLDITYLKDKYGKKKLPIKSVLLDQSIVVGIGNIYADEILFLSGINPFKKACMLNDDEINNIIINTRRVLEEAIEAGGTTIRSYSSVNGVHGLFQQNLCVHSREGEECPKCKNIIIKTKIGGRGTYYCDSCQK